VKWIGYKDSAAGIAKVYVDGTLVQQVDLYSTTAQAKTVIYSNTGLAAGTHTLTVEVTGTKNPSSRSAWVWVDAFDFAP
jgi:hypothetical protein